MGWILKIPKGRMLPGLYSCGQNSKYGQLGLNDLVNRKRFTFVGSGWADATVGGFHSLALRKNGRLYATGNNAWGQLGLGDTTNRMRFRFISDGWAAMACGDSHSLALKTDGDLYSCGWNVNGQLGLNDSGAGTDRDEFTSVSGGWQQISAGGRHSLALTGEIAEVTGTGTGT